jgi:type I restriction enzyme S subunit
MKKLPDGWVIAKFGDVLESIVGGSTPSKSNAAYFRGSIPFMTVKDMTERFPSKTVDHISKEALQQISSGLAPKDSLIISVRMSLGKIVRPKFATAINQDLKVLNVKNGFDKTYVEYFWRSKWSEIQKLGTGTTVKGIRLDNIQNLEIPIPPYLEQQRISEKLDSILALVDKTHKRLEKIPAILMRFRQAVLATATCGGLTAKWRSDHKKEFLWNTVELRSVSTEFNYGTSAKSDKSGKIPVLRMGNIQHGRLDWRALVYTSDPIEIEKFKLVSGDVLFNRTNSPELVGKAAVYREERDAIFAGYLIRIRCTSDLVPEYLNYCLGSPKGRDFCWKVKVDGVSQSNINAKKLAGFTFQLPPVDEQIEICKQISFLLEFANSIESKCVAALDRIEKITPSVLAKAYHGNLVPQDPNDETAEILLSKIEEYYSSSTSLPKPPTNKKRPRMKLTKTILEETLENFPSSRFTFSELLNQSGYDYETLKDLIFDLLDTEAPQIKQVFDTSSGEVHLERK